MKLIFPLFICIIFISLSCEKNVDPLIGSDEIIPGREIAQEVDLIYSDSAKIQFRILTPIMETYREEDKLVEEYTSGLHIDFYNDNQVVSSSIQANYAKRVSKDGTMTLRDNVVLVNDKGDKLTTTGIVWNEIEHTLRTSKFVQLIKVGAQDTFYGFGFYAKDDFSKFSITQLTGKRRYQDLTKELGLKED